MPIEEKTVELPSGRTVRIRRPGVCGMLYAVGNASKNDAESADQSLNFGIRMAEACCMDPRVTADESKVGTADREGTLYIHIDDFGPVDGMALCHACQTFANLEEVAESVRPFRKTQPSSSSST